MLRPLESSTSTLSSERFTVPSKARLTQPGCSLNSSWLAGLLTFNRALAEAGAAVVHADATASTSIVTTANKRLIKTPLRSAADPGTDRCRQGLTTGSSMLRRVGEDFVA